MDALTYAGLWALSDHFCINLDAHVRDSRYHVNEPVTPELLYDAYAKGFSISGYTAKPDVNNMMVTHVGAIDFDHTPDGAAQAVRETLIKLDIPTLMVESRRGHHLWAFVQGDKGHDVSARIVRRALTEAVRLTDPELLKGCEVFPKDSGAAFGVGALRLPLMKHPKDGKRYPAYDMDGKRLTKLIEVVEAIIYADYEDVFVLAEKAPLEYPRQLGDYRKPTYNASAGSAVSMLADLGVLDVTPGRSCRCPFHEDAHASLSVAKDDQRIWCKAPECVAHNGGRGVGTLALAKMVREVNR